MDVQLHVAALGTSPGVMTALKLLFGGGPDERGACGGSCFSPSAGVQHCEARYGEAGESVRNARVVLLSLQIPNPGERTDPFRVRGLHANGRPRIMSLRTFRRASIASWLKHGRGMRTQTNRDASTFLRQSRCKCIAWTHPARCHLPVDLVSRSCDALQAETLALRAGDDAERIFILCPFPRSICESCHRPTNRVARGQLRLSVLDEWMLVFGDGLAQNSTTLQQGQ